MWCTSGEIIRWTLELYFSILNDRIVDCDLKLYHKYKFWEHFTAYSVKVIKLMQHFFL